MSVELSHNYNRKLFTKFFINSSEGGGLNPMKPSLDPPLLRDQ